MTTMTPAQVPPPAAPQPAARRPAVRTRHRIPIDVAGKHGPVWGAVNVAGWLLAGGVAGVLFHAPWPWAPGFGFLGMCGALIAAGTRNDARPYTPEAFAYRAVCWIAGSTWLTWVLTGRPSWVSAMVVLVGGTVVLDTLAPLASKRRKAASARLLAVPTPLTLNEEGARWEKLINQASKGALNVKVLGIKGWKEAPGKTIDLDMRGAPWRRLQSYCDDLAALIKLPNGGNITAARGINRGRALLHIATSDATEEERWVGADRSALSILNGLFVGWLRDGQELFADIREATWLVIGRKGSGKTTWLNSVIAWLTRCTDCIVGVIDMNSGALGVPWARAFMEGRVDHPAIEWLAGDPAEAALMARALLAVALGRKRRSGRLKRLLNVTLMPIGNGVVQMIAGKAVALPAEVVIVVDEGREIFGERAQYRQVCDDLMAVQALARDAGINLVITGLDGTSSSVSPFVKKQCEQRICLPVSDVAEIEYVLDWGAGFKPEDMPGKGKGLAKLDGAAGAVPFGGPNMLPDQVDEHAIAVAGLRPVFTDEDLADIEEALGPGVFEARWERARYLFDLDDNDEEEPKVSMRKTDPVPVPKQPGGGMDALNADLAAAANSLEVLRQEAARGPAPEQADDESWRRISPEEYATMQAFWAKTEELEAAIRSATDPVKRDALIDQLRAHRASALEGIEDTGMPEVEKARAEIDRLNAAWDMPEYRPPAEPEAAVKDWRTRARQLLKAAGAEGAGPQAIAERLQREGFSTVRQTVSDWLSGEVAKKRAVKLEYGLYAYRDAA